MLSYLKDFIDRWNQNDISNSKNMNVESKKNVHMKDINQLPVNSDRNSNEVLSSKRNEFMNVKNTVDKENNYCKQEKNEFSKEKILELRKYFQEKFGFRNRRFIA